MEMECVCDRDGETGYGYTNVHMGGFAVVGYLLYRFSQTLPALIRWPIRLFCSVTGLSALWAWVGSLVGTLRGIQRLFKCLSRMWRFIVALSSKLKWLDTVVRAITGSSANVDRLRPTTPTKPGLRLILLGPAGGGRTALANTLLGRSDPDPHVGHVMMESTRHTTVLNGREITVIDTPDLLGSSLGTLRRAVEALRSLQLVAPGPHAFLLVVPAPGSGKEIGQDPNQALRAVLDLFGEEVLGHVIPVLTHADGLGRKHTVDRLLDEDPGALRRVVSLCGQRPELLDNRAESPLEEQAEARRQLVERVMEMKELKGHFIHQLQRREEELLTDMASALSGKLGHLNE